MHGPVARMVETPSARHGLGERHEPRTVLRNPREFGKRTYPDTVDVPEDQRIRSQGDLAQHDFVRGIRSCLRERGMTVTDLSRVTGLNYQRLTRVFRGTSVMRIDDIGAIRAVLPEAFPSARPGELPHTPLGSAPSQEMDRRKS